jgi:putative MFS transporter
MMSEQSAQPAASPSLVARMNRLPVATRQHKRWVWLLCAVFLFELADLNTFGFAAPGLIKYWHMSVGSVGNITSAAFLGMFAGALVGGKTADQIGRRRALIASAVLYSVFSLVTAAATNVAMLLVFRFFTGMGMEAMTVIGLTYVSEMYPRAFRGRYQSLILGIGLIGIPAMSWFARAVVPLGADGWRWVFVLGAGGLIAAGLMVRYLPESIRWQEAQGQGERAEALLAELEAEAVAKTGEPLPEPEPEAITVPGRYKELFGRSYARRTAVLSLAWIFGILGFYGFNGWVPTLLLEHGYQLTQSLTYTAIISIGAVPGGLFAWLFTDRWQRKYALLVFCTLIAILILVYGFVPNQAVVLVIGFFVTFFLQTETALIYTYTPEIFPTRLRGAGAGFTDGLGRLAGFAGGYLVASIFSGFGYAAVFIYVAIGMAGEGVILGLFGERTSRQSLEGIAAEKALPTEKVQSA